MITYDAEKERLTITSDEGSIVIINNMLFEINNGKLEIGNPRAIAAELVVTVAKSLETETITFKNN